MPERLSTEQLRMIAARANRNDEIHGEPRRMADELLQVRERIATLEANARGLQDERDEARRAIGALQGDELLRACKWIELERQVQSREEELTSVYTQRDEARQELAAARADLQRAERARDAAEAAQERERVARVLALREVERRVADSGRGSTHPHLVDPSPRPCARCGHTTFVHGLRGCVSCDCPSFVTAGPAPTEDPTDA